MARRSDRVLIWIGLFKLAKVAALVTIGVTALLVSPGEIDSHLRRWATELGITPGNRMLGAAIHAVWRGGHHALAEVGIGSLCYAVLFAIEGYGLVRRRLWGEYATIAITGSFLPLEIFELWRRATWLRGTLAALNVAIVAYLIWRLRRDGHWPWHRPRR